MSKSWPKMNGYFRNDFVEFGSEMLAENLSKLHLSWYHDFSENSNNFTIVTE